MRKKYCRFYSMFFENMALVSDRLDGAKFLEWWMRESILAALSYNKWSFSFRDEFEDDTEVLLTSSAGVSDE